MPKPNILFIGNYNREDYIDLLLKSKDECNFFFLEFSSPKETKNYYYQKYGKAIFWGDYHDVHDLLDQIKPLKVLFLFIESYYHVALNLACKSRKIHTYHLEHGLRADYFPGLHTEKKPSTSQLLLAKAAHYRKVLTDLPARARARLFLLQSIKVLPKEDATFLKDFVKIRRQHDHLETFKTIKSDKRLPSAYISFSTKVFQIHQLHDHLTPAQKVHYIGAPYFDIFHDASAQALQRAILFIDQPLAEHKLLGWTSDLKQEFTLKLIQICSVYQYKLYIKPHPNQDLNMLNKLRSRNGIALVSNHELPAISKSTPLVLGFYSTLLMPLAAFSHTTVVTYENHPIGNRLVSKPYTEAGVAHPIYDLEELNDILPHIEELHQKQLPNKAKFTEDWMYKFDGKAGERLRDILLSDEL